MVEIAITACQRSCKSSGGATCFVAFASLSLLAGVVFDGGINSLRLTECSF